MASTLETHSHAHVHAHAFEQLHSNEATGRGKHMVSNLLLAQRSNHRVTRKKREQTVLDSTHALSPKTHRTFVVLMSQSSWPELPILVCSRLSATTQAMSQHRYFLQRKEISFATLPSAQRLLEHKPTCGGRQIHRHVRNNASTP